MSGALVCALHAISPPFGVPNVSDPLQPGTEPDTNTYKLEVSSDCEETAGRKAIFFNSLLPPGTDLRIDYEAEVDI